MAEVLVRFDRVVTAQDGSAHAARVCGRELESGQWEGWIEFDPREGGGVTLRTPRETVQPNRADLEYWATGLTLTYLQGALERARRPAAAARPAALVPERPAYDGPAVPPAPVPWPTATPPRRAPLLDPYAVYTQGENVLRRELLALDEARLRDIVWAYDLVGEVEWDERAADRRALAEMIIAAIRKNAG